MPKDLVVTIEACVECNGHTVYLAKRKLYYCVKCQCVTDTKTVVLSENVTYSIKEEKTNVKNER